MSNASLDVLRSIQADNLLAGLPILTKALGIRDTMVYQDVPFTKYFNDLQDQIAAIGHIQLWEVVEVGTASTYMAEMTASYDSVLSAIFRAESMTMTFLGRAKAIAFSAKALKDPFRVYWTLGASEIIETSALKKLNATDLKALASWEYTRLLEEADLELSALVEALDMTLDHLKAMRRLAQEKYSMAKDQINASLAALDISTSNVGLAAPAQHSRTSSPSLKNILGDRVKDPEMASPVLASEPPATEDEEVEFMPPAHVVVEAPAAPVDLDSDSSQCPDDDLDSPVINPMDPALRMTPERIAAANAKAKAKAPVEREATPEEELAGTPIAEAIAAAPEPETEVKKPVKVEPEVTMTNIDIMAPGITHRGDVKLQRNRSFLLLGGQTDPEENGKWIWMGPDVPMVRVQTKTSPSPAPEPVSAVAVTTETTQAALPEPPAQDEPAVKTTVEQLLVSDPFVGPTKGKAIADALVAKPVSNDLEDDEDLPAPPAAPKGLIMDEDDDLPAPPANPKSSYDTATPERIREQVAELNGVEFQDLPAGAKPLDLEEELVTTTAAITKATQPPPAKPAVALFRPRGLAPGQTMAPAFTPSRPLPEGDLDIDELL